MRQRVAVIDTILYIGYSLLYAGHRVQWSAMKLRNTLQRGGSYAEGWQTWLVLHMQEVHRPIGEDAQAREFGWINPNRRFEHQELQEVQGSEGA